MQLRLVQRHRVPPLHQDCGIGRGDYHHRSDTPANFNMLLGRGANFRAVDFQLGFTRNVW